MKRLINTLFAVAITAFVGISCSTDPLSEESVVQVPRVENNAFDDWLDANFLQPYNIRIKYRYELNETNLSYWTVPPDIDHSCILAHLVKYLCVDTYDEVAGIDFTRAYFPKSFYFEGEWHYDNNGTMILGTAEGGRKIFLGGVNHISSYMALGAEALNEYYIKTIHHEFCHILNQTKDFSTEFQQITGSSYVLSSWNRSSNNLGKGCISAYAQHSAREDFAEMLSEYVTHDQAWWDEQLAEATKETAALNADPAREREYEDGAVLIAQKLDIVRDYMQVAWNIDLDVLRATVLRRTADVIDGKVDLTDITIR